MTGVQTCALPIFCQIIIERLRICCYLIIFICFSCRVIPILSLIHISFFREKGDGVALQIRATHRRTRETEPPDCGTFKGNGGEMVSKISVGNSLYGSMAYNREKINEAQGRLLTTLSLIHIYLRRR